MEYKRQGELVFIRLDKGDEILSCLKRICSTENVKAGSISGIGATDDFTVGVFDIKEKRYIEYFFNENHEINSICGNVTHVNGEPYIHVHVTCTGEGCRVVGGHLLRGVVSLTCEIILNTSTVYLSREKDKEKGINVWKF